MHRYHGVGRRAATMYHIYIKYVRGKLGSGASWIMVQKNSHDISLPVGLHVTSTFYGARPMVTPCCGDRATRV